MKLKPLFILITVLAPFFGACEKDEDPDSSTDEEFTNKWTYNWMKRVYFWNEQLPKSPDHMQSPDKFFYDILYKYNSVDGDRFSWIEKDQSKQTKSLFADTGLGFDYIPQSYFTAPGSPNSVLGFFVISVDKGSDAEKKGVERGQVIHEVNKTPVTYDNYETVLKGAASYTLGIYNKAGQKQTLAAFSPSAPQPAPVFLSKVITAKNGVKVGYLVYNAFERNSDGVDKNYEYDIQLIEKIRELNSLGVTEFVLDLRYNLGGYLTSAMDLASALVPNRNTRNIFTKETYNKYYTDSLTARYGPDAFNEYFLDKVYGTQVDIPRLNLNRLYVIATGYTASASELLMHGLRPYMPVWHIGETTVGKDKGSQTIKSDDKRILWQLQPLISKFTDADGKGDYINGLSPDYEVSEWEEGYEMVDAFYIDEKGNKIENRLPLLSVWKGGFSELGDESEPLLAEALALITGIPRKTTKSATDGNWAPQKVPFVKFDTKKRAVTIIDK
ncbi:MAG: hypothetical protein LBR26_15030 [Prevotella sp.]|jgi:C-terminal processing protease CtpA/Prc|nr:hypothetical protein [Prevotella sp.]